MLNQCACRVREYGLNAGIRPLTTLRKKNSHPVSARFLKHPFHHIKPVIGWLVGKSAVAAQRSGLRLSGTKYHPPNPRVNQCAYAHQTGFNRHIKYAAGQTVALGQCSLSQGQNFCMGRGIVAINGSVGRLPDDPIVLLRLRQRVPLRSLRPDPLLQLAAYSLRRGLCIALRFGNDGGKPG